VLTAKAALDGRLTLGIGPSHQPVVEGMFGYSFDRPHDRIAPRPLGAGLGPSSPLAPARRRTLSAVRSMRLVTGVRL
jgi:hypothetical protein